jgi:RNA polymerase sigma-70 factor (ECF subfamily)
MDEADILARLRSREFRAAFELLLPRYRDHVFRLAWSLLRDQAAAEDAVQDVMLRVWRALPGYNFKAALGTWIYAITRNTCLSELRKKRPHVPLQDYLDHPDEDQLEGAAHGAPEPVFAAPDQDDSALASVTRLLDRLPERYAQAVTLFYMEDKSYEQTAASLGVPLGTVKAMLHRARKRLIELVESEQ